MSNKSSKSDPPSLKLDPPFVKELVALGFPADDPEEITEVTARAALAIYNDQKTNRDNDTRSLLAILNVINKMRKEQRLAAHRQRQILYTIAVIAFAIGMLDKLGLIRFTLH